MARTILSLINLGNRVIAMEHVSAVTNDNMSTSEVQLANLQSYGLSVQAAIGPKLLDGGGLQGRVLVAFSLGTDGSLVGVRIAQSSGHQRLDSQAVQLIGRASFPLPPGQMSAAQRTYLSAFTFK
jgi:TonB family protein